MIDLERIVALDKIHVILIIQDREGEGALHLLRHMLQRLTRNVCFPFQQLARHIAVRLDVGPKQSLLFVKGRVIVDHPVVGQDKGPPSGSGLNGMVVIVFLGTSLGGHAGMAQHRSSALRNINAELMGRDSPLIDMECPFVVVGHSSSIRPFGFTGYIQGPDNPAFLRTGSFLCVVYHSK